MSIFDSIGRSNPAGSAIDPKQLFRVLPKPQGSPYRFPHDIQSEVWDKWFDRRNERDLVVKMNTGSGKTVIGLVILKSSLNEGKGPAVYLVPDTQLKSQVQKTAEGLGIAWTEDLDDPIFRQSQAVLITTVHTMFNGRSRFGVRGSTGRPIQVGTVVIDDAHACIPIVEHQFSMEIPSASPQYQPSHEMGHRLSWCPRPLPAARCPRRTVDVRPGLQQTQIEEQIRQAARDVCGVTHIERSCA